MTKINIITKTKPAGPEGALQFKTGNAFNGTARLIWDDVNKQLTFSTAADGSAFIFSASGDAGNLSAVNLNIRGGSAFDDGISTPANGGGLNLVGGPGVNGGDGGNLDLGGGDSPSGQGGSVRLAVGSGNTAGNFTVSGLQTFDPSVTDALWLYNGVLMMSGSTFPAPAASGPDMAVQFGNAGMIAGSQRLLFDQSSAFMSIGEPNQDASIGAAQGDINFPNSPRLSIFASDGFDDGMSTAANGGDLNLFTGAGVNDGNGGSFFISAGDAPGNGTGGSVQVYIGASATGTPGNMVITNLPSSDPGVPGALYQTAGVVMISL